MQSEVVASSWVRLSSYRGVILDILVIAINFFVAPRAATWVIDLIRAAQGDQARGVIVGLCMLAMLALPAVAAVLKRRRTHARLAAEANSAGLERIALEPGCLFNPVIYLCVNLVLGCGVVAGLGPLVFGGDLMDRGGVFVPLLLLVIVASVVQTGIVYRYFEPLPATARPSRFLESHTAELIGDACLYLNTLLVQVLWLALATVPFERVSGFEDIVGRLLFISFAALLVYFPPRLLYLVEDLRRPAARVTLLVATAAMVYRLVLGSG